MRMKMVCDDRTLAEVANEFLALKKAQKVRERTLNDYKKYIDKFLEQGDAERIRFTSPRYSSIIAKCSLFIIFIYPLRFKFVSCKSGSLYCIHRLAPSGLQSANPDASVFGYDCPGYTIQLS